MRKTYPRQFCQDKGGHRFTLRDLVRAATPLLKTEVKAPFDPHTPC
jgi:hypothetical protein